MAKKLSQSQLKRIMQLEMKKLMDEDALFMQKTIPGDYDYNVINFQRSDPMPKMGIVPHHHDDEPCCDVCAAEKHKDDCVCDVCSMKKIGIFEGCVCDDQSYEYENPYTMEREEDYDLDYHDDHHGHIQVRDISSLDPDSAYGLGLTVGQSGEFDHDHHEHSSYMARPQLYKIAKYASKLLDMVDEHEELEDWQESKIAQIAQMIGSVYHSLDYDEEYEEDDNILMSHLV